MSDVLESYQSLLGYAKQLMQRYELSKTVDDSYFEPGMMEYLDQSYGEFNNETNKLILRFEIKGTRYEGRTERLELTNFNDPVKIIREAKNAFNSNNFMIVNDRHQTLGNMPAELCNVLAPLYDGGYATIDSSRISFVEPISKRSKHAKQGIAFVEVIISFKGI